MKCQRCGGSGKYMREIGGYRPCKYCDGTGEIVQTNEEWFCNLDTEEKAKVIVDLGRKQRFPKDIEVEFCEQWLKEKHE